MSDVLMVGCDLHDKTLMLKSCVGKDGVVATRTVPNDRGSRRILMELLRDIAARAGAERIVFAYEASGQGFGLYDQLREAGLECHVLAPTKMPKTPGERKRKTDDRDAQKILDLVRAHVLAGASLPTVWVPGKETRDDREVVRQRITVAAKRCKVKTQIQSLLKRFDLRKPLDVKSAWSKAFDSWLRQLAVGTMSDGSPSPLGWGVRHTLSSLLRGGHASPQHPPVAQSSSGARSSCVRHRFAFFLIPNSDKRSSRRPELIVIESRFLRGSSLPVSVYVVCVTNPETSERFARNVVD